MAQSVEHLYREKYFICPFRQTTTLSSERRAAKQELENTVQLTRSTLARIVPRSNHPEQNYFTQTCPTRKPTATTRTMTTKTLRQSNAASRRNEVALGGLDRSGYYQNANVVWDQMGESLHSVLSHAYTDPAYTAQLPYKNDVTVNTLQMQLEQQSCLVQRLQTTIDQQRELSTRQLRDTQQEAEKRLESIKVDYEATLKRNYTLIDELVEEKKALHVKCEALLTELKTMAQKSEEKLKVIEDRHKIELKKLEAKMTAAEKLRREKWEAEKTKQMKEMTVRGMESELARLIASHQAEMRQIRQSCAEQVQAADIRAYQAYTGQIEEIRQTLTREKDEACAREREAATQRLEKTLSDERAALDQQRRRLMNEVAEERERIALTCAREREEIERGRQNLESRLETLTSKYERELVQQREELVKRHEKELEELQLREHAEREAWEEHTKSVLEVQCSARENGLRDQLKRERDRQLEAAIRRLEKESDETRAEVEREAESKIKRIREKLGAEITEIERSERQAMEKYCEMKTKLLDKEHESDRLRIQLQQREQEMHDIRALYEKLNQERQNMSDVVRQEFADRLVTLEEENRTAKRELAEFKARLAKEQERHESDLAALKRANADELETVHQKIKDAIKRKDEKTNQMRNHFEKELEKQAAEVEEANRRAEHLEELLDQQRKQFLQTMR
ncbi:hypothetical protein FGIG_03823 [Fasciola gigantica]|uniref:5-azacytidine-induced protein 1 n=1 Tax=Fasciola gigantica TaxID=46835 RepID=A0A504YI27_FASGI|nr:hypothetical protein FGIG_03823 [Fasciola gigantica]